MPDSSATTVDAYDPALGYHPSAIPLDIRLGLTSPPSLQGASDVNKRPLRWGILGCSKVAHDFAQALKFLRSNGLPHEITAVGSRSVRRAEEFADLHKIPHAHGSYEELCNDATVDIIYVASLHPYHREHAEMALRNGKHVLVEKPMTMKAGDARFLYELSKELNLFAGEGMWTRFFPAVEWARQRLGEDDGNSDCDVVPIGRVRVVNADFSIDGDDVGPYPIDSLYAKELGGGSAWCVMPYVVGAALLPFNTMPDRIAANGILPEDDEAGDLALGMTLTFTNKSAGGGTGSGSPPEHRSIASGVCGYLAESCERTTYSAKRGRITIESPAHCPTSATVVRKAAGTRGHGATSSTHGDDVPDEESGSSAVEFPLPESTPEIEASGGIRLPNSMGFVYEAEAVRRLIEAGRTSFPQWTPNESVGCIETIEGMLRQIRAAQEEDEEEEISSAMSRD
ncbi:hypothetical protein ACHAXT_008496 [Thalassiosira profunda]